VFSNDENGSVIGSAMDTLRSSKKITPLTVTVLFLFAFFNLILDALECLAGKICFFAKAKLRKKIRNICNTLFLIGKLHKRILYL
jgi:hypothetical protein